MIDIKVNGRTAITHVEWETAQLLFHEMGRIVCGEIKFVVRLTGRLLAGINEYEVFETPEWGCPIGTHFSS